MAALLTAAAAVVVLLASIAAGRPRFGCARRILLRFARKLVEICRGLLLLGVRLAVAALIASLLWFTRAHG